MTKGSGNDIRIIIAAGGSGGHIFPALAVMDQLNKSNPDLRFTWFGSSHRMESTLIPERGIDFVPLRTTEIRRKPTPANLFYNIRSLWYLAASIYTSIGYINRLKPALVLTTGGFAAGAMGLAAWFTRTPLAIIEPNAYPGMTNRWLGQRASIVFTAYPAASKYFPSKRTFSVGVPARSEILSVDRNAARLEMGLSDDTVFILAMGGSQGAAGINNILPDAVKLSVDSVVDRKIHILHQCGKGKLERVEIPEAVEYEVIEFIDDVPAKLAAADIIVCRAGASTLSEIALRQLPAVIIPYPQSAENHQVSNAESWETEGAGFCIEEKTLTPEILAAKLTLLITDKNKRSELGESAMKFANPDSAEIITGRLAELIKNRAT